MSTDGHGYIGIVTLADGSCINVSLPVQRSRPVAYGICTRFLVFVK